MLCEDGGINRETILRNLGEFNNRDKILKKMARVGQNFSSTKRIKKMPQKNDPEENKES